MTQREHAPAILGEVHSACLAAEIERPTVDFATGARCFYLEHDSAYGAIRKLSRVRFRLLDCVGRPADRSDPSTTLATGELAVDGLP